MPRYLLVGLVLSLGICGGCGAQGSSAQADPCAQTVLEVEGRIAPESSGLTCAGVRRQLQGGVPATPGNYLFASGKPKVTWKCHLYPSSGDSRNLITCRSGKKQFAIRRVQLSRP
jgi:hypothetical protein